MELFLLILTIVLALLFIYIALLKIFPDRSFEYPPGPKGLPFFGSIFQIRPRAYLALEKFGKKYGPVYSVPIGMNRFVVLNSYEAIKEVLVNQGNISSGRFQAPFIQKITHNQGIINTDGDDWKRQRRTALQILKDFGFGRELSKQVVQNEIEDAIAIIKLKKGTPFETQKFFSYCTINVITGFTLNERPAHTDPHFQHVLECLDKLVNLSFLSQFFLFYTWILEIPYLFNILDLIAKRLDTVGQVHKFVMEKMESHRKTIDPQQEPRDFIDSMLLLQKEAELEPNYKKETYDLRILNTILDLFIAGNDTTASTLSWMFFLLAVHQDVQKKMQNELDSICDRNAPIRPENKKLLPYCCAVIDEVTRFASIVPLSLFHRVVENTKVFEYNIPKDTLVIPNIYAVHHDPSYWEKPNQFYPEHFLSSDGNYRSHDHFIPFSVGPRACMGEALANLEMFLFSVSFVREFNIELGDKYSQKDIDDILLGNDGTIRRILHHTLAFKSRD